MGTDIEITGTARARVNWGRWIVDCTTCTSALALPPGTEAMQCWDCGAIVPLIVWPPDVASIEAVLAYRPDPNTRNWEPGETVTDLIAENAVHGIVPSEWREALESVPGAGVRELDVATVVNGVVVSGELLTHQIDAAHDRWQIGA